MYKNKITKIISSILLLIFLVQNTYLPTIIYAEGDTQPPTAPKSLKATSRTSATSTLAWSESTDNVGVTGYEIYRNGQIIGTATPDNLTYTDNGLSGTTTYIYSIKAFDAELNKSQQSNVINVTTLDGEIPTPPSNLTILSKSTTSVTLGWSDSTDNIGIKYYKILRNNVVIEDTKELTITDNNLLPGTLYTYIVRAYDDAGNKADSTISVTTGGPTPPKTLKLVAKTGNSITLSWIKGEGEDIPFGYIIYRDGINIANTSELTFIDIGLLTSKTYIYSVVAYDNFGNYSTKSNSIIATTKDDVPPIISENFVVTSKTKTSVTLEWTASTDNIGVELYYIYRDNVLINSTKNLEYTDNNLISGTSYIYKIRAFDGTNYSDFKTVTALTDGLTIPIKVAILSRTETSIKLKWTKVLGNVDIAGYEIYRNGVLIGTSETESYTDQGLTKGTAYSYTIKSYDTSLNKSNPSVSVVLSTIGFSTLVDTQSPSIPMNLIVLSKTNEDVTLGWDASTDNVGVIYYRIYRNNVLIGNTTLLSFTDANIATGTTYTYMVRPYDAKNNYSQTAINVTTLGAVIPTGLKILLNTGSSILLGWTANSTETEGYEIYRDDVAIGTVEGHDKISYSDNSVTTGVTYVYTVKAYDINGNRSPASTLLKVIAKDNIPPSEPNNFHSTEQVQKSITLEWEASTDNISTPYYRIYRDNILVETTSALNYTDTGLEPGKSYTYTVWAYDLAGNRTSSKIVVATQGMPIVEGLNLLTRTGTSVTIGWTKNFENTGTIGYEVYRNGVAVGTTDSNKFTDINLNSAKSYIYTIKSYDNLQNKSLQSKSLIVITFDNVAPTQPQNFKVDSKTDNSVNLSWSNSSDNVGVIYYGIYRNNILIDKTTSLNYTDTNLLVGTTYTYIVKVFDGAGNNSGSALLETTTGGQTQISSLKLLLRTDTSVKIGWTLGAEIPEIVSYEITRNDVVVDTISSLNLDYDDSNVVPFTLYKYIVKGIDNEGTKYQIGKLLSVTTLDKEKPTSPENFREVSKTETSIIIGWNAATDNTSIKYYNVYRDGVFLVKTTDLNYTDTGLTPAKAYKYIVRAYDNSGNYSDSVIIITTNGIAGPKNIKKLSNTGTTIMLGWDKNDESTGTIGYEIYRNGVAIGTTTQTTYSDTGLSDATNYVYIVKAFDIFGTRSINNNFITITAIDSEKPTSPVNLAVTSKTETTITLNWESSTDNTNIKYYGIYRNNALISRTTQLTYTDTGLTSGVAYKYMVRAYDSGNNYADSIISAVTGGLSAPKSVRVVSKTHTTVLLSFANGDGEVVPIGYEIYREGELIGSTTGTTTTYSDTGLMAETTYVYTVKAIDGEGNKSISSNSLVVTTTGGVLIADTEPPTMPTNLIAISKTDTNVSLGWDASSDNVKVTYYGINRNGVRIGNSTTLGFTDVGLLPSTTYNYVVIAYDAKGNKTSSDLFTVVTDGVSAPINLVIKSKTDSTAVLEWAKTDGSVHGGYEVYCDGTLIGTTPSLTYTDTGLVGTTTYIYTVKAYDNSGNKSANSNFVIVSTLDVEPPTAPTNLMVSSKDDKSVSLSWEASTDNVGVNYYSVYRGNVKIGASSELTFVDLGLSPNTTYLYKIVASDAGGNKTNSGVLSVTTDAEQAPTETIISSGMTLTEDLSYLGDVIVTGGSINLNGYKLTVAGNLIQSDGSMNIGGGQLLVGGDYRIQSRIIDGGTVTYGNSMGILMMTNTNSYVLVNGDFITQSTNGS